MAVLVPLLDSFYFHDRFAICSFARGGERGFVEIVRQLSRGSQVESGALAIRELEDDLTPTNLFSPRVVLTEARAVFACAGIEILRRPQCK